ncbi:hypothetical protein WJX73_010289 [Symbiochloris irregularis]|uniref:Uncharacterized protein n=1 Tax=Symbiochloris irregularis TaxID=706552 RepID=A0AAW1PZI9_9CHLO
MLLRPRLQLAALAALVALHVTAAENLPSAPLAEEFSGRGPKRDLLVTGHKKGGGLGSKTCMAEDQCINKYCGKGYDHTATKFPYYVNYTKWEWPNEDVFDFRVCTNQCQPDDRYCEPLKSWAIRLDTELVTNADYLRKVEPEGQLVSECGETGIGYHWEGESLGALAGHHPKDGHKCEKFLMRVRHDPHMAGHFWLTDICQQRIDIVATKNGKTMFSQTSVVVAKDKFSDIGSCLIHFQTDGGVYGFTLLEDHEFYAKDTRPDEHIPDLSQNPNDPFDNSRRRRLLAEDAGHYLSAQSDHDAEPLRVHHGRAGATRNLQGEYEELYDFPSPGVPAHLI